MEDMTIQGISYGGWDNCVQITNGIADLVVTTDVGPRIIRYGFAGQENELGEIESTKGLTGGKEWRIYGGHRLWHSPEDESRTYEPDNFPVDWVEITNGIRTVQSVERGTGIKKEMEIHLSPESSRVKVLHRLTNSGLWTIELSVWSISAMATGGTEIIPISGKNTGLLPDRLMALWPYTKLNDSRVTFGDRYIILQQSPDQAQPFKLGTSNEHGWAAYFNHNHLFVKYYNHYQNARYPDFGASYETYVNDFMLEMETLSPLVLLERGAHADHEETWELFNHIQAPAHDEDEIDRILRSNITIPK
jgi:hypothetical protein